MATWICEGTDSNLQSSSAPAVVLTDLPGGGYPA